MANATARTYIQPYLTLPSYLAVRIIYPLLAYIPLSLSYAMISLPFKLPFGAKYEFFFLPSHFQFSLIRGRVPFIDAAMIAKQTHTNSLLSPLHYLLATSKTRVD